MQAVHVMLDERRKP